MNVFSWLLFGLLAGAIAKLIMPGKDPGGCLVTIALGITGALIGGFIGSSVLGFGRVDGFNLRSLGIAILGASVLLMLYRLLLQRRRRP
ncbi:MAG TPA: GlsB/YeaQ/YmgE family stress response membrane protein [Longimicrobiales bacterium]|nr:GlsB/YeaQ/YmgE family stress response membrane protein [Longimicrobiales bacterium]